ncbi:protein DETOXIFICATION 33 [Sesamum angolense]|uniref:Protein DETOXIFICATION n=1 Tax=Sesamum angolense TaxID=2727404 RepID=A0AAE1WC41_9LAMI|nr:protein DETOXIFICATION 33 [Sesamum angolense]
MEGGVKEALLEKRHHQEKGGEGFIKEFGAESKTLWKLSGPAIFTSICQYSLGALTQTFAGQVGEIELAAVSVENSVIAGLAFGAMVKLNPQSHLTTTNFMFEIFPQLQTLLVAAGNGKRAGDAAAGIRCRAGEDVGRIHAEVMGHTAGHRVRAAPALHLRSARPSLLRESAEISRAAGWSICTVDDTTAVRVRFEFSNTEIPAVAEEDDGDGVDFGHRFGSAHGFQLVADTETGVGVGGSRRDSEHVVVAHHRSAVDLHILHEIRWCLGWILVVGVPRLVQLRQALSRLLYNVVFWYLMVIIVIAGHLDNPVVPVDAISICLNIQGWDAMISFGFNAAISCGGLDHNGVYWGGRHGGRYSGQNVFPYLFTNSEAVAKETTRLSILLAVTVLLNGLQPVLSGVAVGAGWQSLVAYINIGCYYIVGLPLGIVLGFVFKLGAMGIWGGMIGGIILQTLILIGVTSSRNWDTEAKEALNRVRQWGGAIADQSRETRLCSKTPSPVLLQHSCSFICEVVVACGREFSNKNGNNIGSSSDQMLR